MCPNRRIELNHSYLCSLSTQNVNKNKLTRIDSTHSSSAHVYKPLSPQINNIAPLLEAKPPTASPGHRRKNSQMSDSETSDMKSSSEEVSSKSHSKKKSPDDTISSASSSPELGRKKWTPPSDNTAGPQAFRLTENDIKSSKKNLIGKQRDTLAKEDVRARRASSVGEPSSDDERDKHKKKKDKKDKDKKAKEALKEKEIKEKEVKEKERSKSPIAIRKMLRSSSSSSIERKGVKKTTSTTAVSPAKETPPALVEEPEKSSESSDSSPSARRRLPLIVMTPSTPPFLPPPLNLSSGSLAITSNSINSITSALSMDNTPISSPHSFEAKKFHISSDSLSSSSDLRKSGSGLSETGEVELEVEDLKSPSFIALSMSRKGTMRNNFANSRARSNSVVASRPGGEILAKRKPTAASKQTVHY